MAWTDRPQGGDVGNRRSGRAENTIRRDRGSGGADRRTGAVREREGGQSQPGAETEAPGIVLPGAHRE